MGTLQRTTWKAWNPNGDAINSSPEGLLRADNIVFEEEGVVKLSRGTTRQSNGPFGATVNGIYSADLLASSLGLTGAKKKVRYISYDGNVVRNYCTPNFLENEYSGGFLSGGDSQVTAFATAWGHNFAFSGTQKRADKGLQADWRDVGIPAPLPPGVAANTPPSINIVDTFALADWNSMEDSGFTRGADYCEVIVNATTLRGILQSQAYGTVVNLDMTDFGSGTGGDTPNDILKVPIRLSDSSKLIKVRCEFLLDTPQIPSASQDITDFYWFEWYSNEAINTNPSYIDPNVFEFSDRQAFIDRVREQLEPGIALETFFREGTNFWGDIQARRYQFKRSGVDATKDWTTVKAFRFIVTAVDSLTFWISTDLKWIGGITGPLSDSFSYKQVNLNDTGEYVEVGLASIASDTIQVFQSSILVTPSAAPGNANKIRIYRASTHTPGYYLVKEGDAPLAAFNDEVSDVDALRIGTILEDYRTALPDGIRIAIGPYYDRMLLFDLSTMYVTYQYDPGSYDGRHAFQITGTENEYILWARKVIDGVILIGTSRDVYQMTGNLAYDEAIGLLDVTITSLGIEQPPVDSCTTVHSNVLYYLAEDGWRNIAGSSSNSIVGAIDLLFRKFNRHGIDAINLGVNGISNCCVSKNRLIASMDFGELGRAILYYDFVRQQWNFWHNDVNFANNALALYAESDGTVLFSTAADGDKYLYEWDSGTTLGEGANQALRLRTIYDSDGKPNNRKEALTLKVLADTGGLQLTLRIRTHTDGAFSGDTAFALNCSGPQTRFFDISSLGKVKRYQIEIEGYAQTFKFYEFAIEYIDLPAQTNYLMLKPSTLGTAGRKRLPVIPMVIDTLGNNVNFEAVLDGVPNSASVINTVDKQIYNHFLPPFTVASNVGGYLTCETGVFEFYELLSQRENEILPDPVKFKWIPSTNFGTTKRKRFGQLAFVIDTKGSNVTFTPYIDMVAKPTNVYNTTNKRTVIYYFDLETVGVDFMATLQSDTGEFEFYELALQDSSYEVLPPAMTFMTLANTNYGVAAKKRIRTLPFVIDTKGASVTFTPTVDGIAQTPSVFNTNGKRTVLHYFQSDVFGIDFGGTLDGTTPFEYYSALQPENVQTLPVGKKWDQLGPMEFNRQAKVRAVRVRVLPEGTQMAFKFYAEDTLIFTKGVTVTANKEQTIELSMPKGITATVLRVEIISGDIFHRFKGDFKLDITGSGTDWRWEAVK